MKICTVVFLLGVMINCTTSMIHTLRYFRTASTQIPRFPRFLEVGLVNDLVITHYDSDTRREVPKQEWMNRVTKDFPQYWEEQTRLNRGNEQVGKVSIECVMQRLNVTEGPHIVQRMTGCDWNEETDEIRGYYQVAFDGEDFIVLDWETQTWVAPKQEAFTTKLTWEKNGAAARYKNYFDQICAQYLKKYVQYGEKTLKRKELPLVSILQKSSSSPVTCHATGFYPRRAMLFWTKDGEELWEEGDAGEILPNHDGTFQSSVSLDMSSVPTNEWDRYSCVFRLSGVPDDLITKLDPGKIRTNEKKHTSYIAVLSLLLGALLFSLTGFIMWWKYRAKQLKLPPSEPEVMEELNPPVSMTQ